jgi:hypothetical protein
MPDQIELWNPHIMRTKNIAACLLSMYAGVSFAAPETWQFTYTGFFDQLAGRFITDHVQRGEFTGEDINHDGIIDTGELTSIIIDGGQNYKTCGGTESPYYVCGVGPFSFTPGGELSFSVGEEFQDRPRLHAAGHRVDTGDRAWSYTIEEGLFVPSQFYRWTPATTLQVSLVPEPAPYAMLVPGLVAAMIFKARRSQRPDH